MPETNKIAVVLSGCGVYDGAEIHEAVFTMLSIAKAGFQYEIFAPNINQHHVINHITGEETNETRNVLVESARIARGNIKPLDKLNSNDFDAVIFPGGFGVAKNLCSFAFDGENCSVNPEIEKTIKKFHSKEKPIGAICISPVLIAKVLQNSKITIGTDLATIEIIEKLNNKHIKSKITEVVVDRRHKIVTSPCYMLDADISQIAKSTDKVMEAIIDLIKEKGADRIL